MKIFLVFVLLVYSSLLHAVAPLVDDVWVKKHRGKQGVVFVDIQEAQSYQRYHLPGAINAPYSRWRTGKEQPPKGMLPKTAVLEKWIGGLGIGNKDTVVISATGLGAGDMAASARVYWTFKMLGHDEVTVLNGGLAVYANNGGPLEKEVNHLPAKSFKASPGKSVLASQQDVKAALKANGTLIDARSRAEYLGIYQASPKERPGTIPGSKSLPYEWLTVNGSGLIHPPEKLGKLFSQRDIHGDGAIHYCHTGSRAALTWFVDYALLGNQKARLYDGSTAEWALDASLPIAAEIDW